MSMNGDVGINGGRRKASGIPNVVHPITHYPRSALHLTLHRRM